MWNVKRNRHWTVQRRYIFYTVCEWIARRRHSLHTHTCTFTWHLFVHRVINELHMWPRYIRSLFLHGRIVFTRLYLFFSFACIFPVHCSIVVFFSLSLRSLSLSLSNLWILDINTYFAYLFIYFRPRYYFHERKCKTHDVLSAHGWSVCSRIVIAISLRLIRCAPHWCTA